MVFHGDYEVEFEIYEKREGDWRSELLGHMAGISAQDAKIRWVEANKVSDERYDKIFALFPVQEL
mgnify:CR=1 FL=1|tara:strand:- start:635 stop:829 length:195 start_codon:yes stop_codon:yes gene_type:complete